MPMSARGWLWLAASWVGRGRAASGRWGGITRLDRLVVRRRRVAGERSHGGAALGRCRGVWRAWAFVRWWFAQIGGASVVGVAGRTREHT